MIFVVFSRIVFSRVLKEIIFVVFSRGFGEELPLARGEEST